MKFLAKQLNKYLPDIFFTNRFLYLLAGVVFVFILGFPYAIFFLFGKILLVLTLLLFVADLVLLYRIKHPFKAHRTCDTKLSNGDENQIILQVESLYPFLVKTELIDEVPDQLQIRDFIIKTDFEAFQHKVIFYKIRPTERGIFTFKNLNIFTISFIGLFKRKVTLDLSQDIAVYPSFIQLRKYSFYAINNRLTEIGVKKIRKLGVNNEFEQIREYVKGDDFRTINWKATARKSNLMVNQYQEERSQNIYCIIDKGRMMHSPFNGLSLIDYAINASLVLSNIAIAKEDKAGIITFSDKIGNLVAASRKTGQMNLILETLYKQKVRLQEPDFGRLYRNIKHNIKQRSLLLLFTNFESPVSLERHIDSIRAMAKDHLLVVVLFENSELTEKINSKAETVEDIYIQTIAEKFAFEKRLIAKELKKYGIQTLLTTPEKLTLNAINKYLEIKAKGMI